MKFQAKKFLSFYYNNIFRMLFLLFIFIISPYKIYASDFGSFVTDLVKNNPEIQASYFNYRSFIDGKMSTIGPYLPQAELHYNYQIQDIDKVTGNITDNYETNEYNIDITQKILIPELKPLLNKTKLATLEALLKYKKTKSEVILDLINTLVTIQTLDQQALFEENNKNLNKNLYKVAQIKSNSGIISQIDLLQSKTEYLKAKSDYIIIIKDLSIAKAHYESLTGSNVIKEFNLEKFITNTNFDLSKTIQSAYRNNFDAIITLNQLSQYKQNKKIEQSDYLPKADLYYNYQKIKGRYSYYTNNDDTNSFSSYGIRVTIPLFTSFKTTSDIASSQDLILVKEQEFSNVTNNLKEEVTRLWETLNVNKALIIEHKSYVEYAEKSYKAIKNQYDARLKDITYLLDAQNTLLDARSKLNHTNAEMMKNYFAIIFLTGKLDENTFLDSLDN
ncbi:MAG: TolC family protein [Rickettsiales bacterium]|jgi:outer membrane protein TolC|nr:TolC family protein [Rickettsiales bacterium]